MINEYSTVCEVQLRYNKLRPKPGKALQSSHDSYHAFKSIWRDIDVYESFNVFLLNRNHKIMALHRVSTGGVSATVVDPKLILAAALKSLSSAIIVAHNHPSGQMLPSKMDKSLTNGLHNACKCMDIKLLDHIILSPFDNDYFSFADEGMMPS